MMHLDRRWFCDERFNRLVAFTDMLSDATSPRGIIGGPIKRTAAGRRTDQIATTSSIARTALGIEGMGKASHQCRADVATACLRNALVTSRSLCSVRMEES